MVVIVTFVLPGDTALMAVLACSAKLAGTRLRLVRVRYCSLAASLRVTPRAAMSGRKSVGT